MSTKLTIWIDDSENENFDEFEGDVSVEQVPTIIPITEPTSSKEIFDIDLGFPN
jgi:hypothetical protein